MGLPPVCDAFQYFFGECFVIGGDQIIHIVARVWPAVGATYLHHGSWIYEERSRYLRAWFRREKKRYLEVSKVGKMGEV